MHAYSVEGNHQMLDGGAMFGNVPRALWQRWLTPDADNRIPLACRCLLVEDLDGKAVLFETGIGAFFEAKLKHRFGVEESGHVLLESLAARGLGHEDIDVVVLSHLHFDHAGGMLTAWREDSDAGLLFPNARFVIGARHWQRAQQPHPRDRASFIPRLNTLLAECDRVEWVEGERSEILGDTVRFSYSEGHTPGLMHAEIGGDGGIVFCADLIPGRPWVHLPVTMGYDRYPERLIEEKRVFLEDKLERGVRLFFTHDPDCAMASVRCDERGRFSACDEQPLVEGEELST